MAQPLQTLRANGVTVRHFTAEGVPYLCGADIVDASGLSRTTNASCIRRRTHIHDVRRVDRRDHPGSFSKRGRPDVLFFSFGALERWARRFPDGPADRLMRELRLTHFKPFAPVDD